MTYPVRYMAVDHMCEDFRIGWAVNDTSDNVWPLCLCYTLDDAVNIARAMNVAEGYRVE
jgi:hypothetical protein